MRKIILFVSVIIIFLGCAKTKNYMAIPPGVNQQKILIQSQPTKAKIYINDIYIGKTPIKTHLWYEKEKFINIKAEPLYPNQFPQNVFIKIPPIPPKITIYMDYEVKERVDFAEQMKQQVIKELEPPAKETIIQLIKEDVPVVLPTIYFETDIFEIPESELYKLDFITELLNSFPDLDISIHAHADERGTPEHNYELSMNRGKEVKKLLQEMNINEARMTIFVHGERIVYSENLTPLSKDINRSVDFILHRKD